jgi:signal transduction histidine kinase
MIAPQADDVIALLRKKGVQLNDVVQLPHSFNPGDLIEDRVDVFSAYITNEPDYLDQRRYAYDVYSPRSDGIDFYGDNLFTSESEIRKHPERVEAFRKASLRGWQYALDNPQEIVDLILKKYSQKNTRNHLLYESQQMVRLIQPVLVEIGYMSRVRWRSIADTYSQLGMLPKDYDFNAMISYRSPQNTSPWWYYPLIVLFLILLGISAFYLVRLVLERNRAREAMSFKNTMLVTQQEASIDGLIAFNIDGSISSTNMRFYDLWQMDEDLTQSPIGMLKSLMFRLDSPTSLVQTIRKFKSDRELVSNIEMPLKDGRIFDCYSSPMINDEGQYFGRLWSFRDMTEAKRIEKESQQMREQLSQASKMESIGHLTGGIAHDFNNILGAMMGYAELSQSKLVAEDNNPIFKYQDAILRSGNRAKEIIREMLAFSRITSNAGELSATATLAASIIEEVVMLLRASLPSGIFIHYGEIDKDLKVRILPVHLHQILLNLIVNAQDAIGSHGVIGISLSKQHYDATLCNSCKTAITGDFVEMKISDDGEGIAGHVLSKMFDPFFTSKGLGEGTGMGLSVVHGLVHAQGGHIHVDTSTGTTAATTTTTTTTTINILLPFLDSSEIVTLEKKAPIALKEGIKGARIMVVDDEVELCGMLNEYLLSNAAESIGFTDPIKALEMFSKNSEQFDLVITDETMPGMSGMELANKMLAIRPEIPIILCTGYSDDASAESAENIGIRHFLNKPVNMNELKLMIQKTI